MENKISQKKIQNFINECKELIKTSGIINNCLFINPNRERIINVSIIHPLHDIQPFRKSKYKIKANQPYLRIKTNKTQDEYDYLLFTIKQEIWDNKLVKFWKEVSIREDWDNYWFGNNYEVLIDNVDIEVDKYISIFETDKNDPNHCIHYTKYMNEDEYKSWYNKTHHITPEYIEYLKKEYDFLKKKYNKYIENYGDDYLKSHHITLDEYFDKHYDLKLIKNGNQ